MKANLPVWRSLLFVPVTQRRFVEGAARRGADGIILDLEDSVAASEKERARSLVAEAAQLVSRGGADVIVRVNRPLRMTVRDLEAVVGAGVQAIALPKAESAQHVELVAEILDELEAERGIATGTTRMLAMVETCSAFFRIAEIARPRRASSRSISGRRISPCRRGCRRPPKGCSCPSRCACWRRAPPASCRWALSARWPISAISTASARRCGARAGSALSAPR